MSHGGTLWYSKIVFIHSFIGHFFIVTTVLESQSNFIGYTFPEFQNISKLLSSMMRNLFSSDCNSTALPQSVLSRMVKCLRNPMIFT